MCIAAFSFNPYSETSLVLGFNRDEYYFRDSLSPDKHWNTSDVVAPKDCQASGTWIGVNTHGLVVCLLNKYLKIDDVIIDGRSRGLLVLDVLKQKRIDNVIYLLDNHDLKKYRPFSLLVFSNEAAYCISNYDNALNFKHSTQSIRPGNHLISHTYMDDPNSARIAKNIPRNNQIDYLNTDDLYNFLNSHEYAPKASMIQNNETWGTVSTSIICQSENYTSFDYYIPNKEGSIYLEVKHEKSQQTKAPVYIGLY